MKKALPTILQYVIFLGLGIWLVYHMLHQLTEEQSNNLVAAIKSVNAWYLIPICFIGFLSHYFRAVRWRYLMEPMDMHPTLANTVFAVMIGYVTNLILPRAGEVAKCTVLAKYEKLPAHKMVGTIVAERAFDMLCLIIITILAFVVQADFVSEYATQIKTKLAGMVHNNEKLIFFSVLFLVLAIVGLVLFYRKHKDNKIGRFLKELSHGILSILHMKKRWPFIGYTVLIWLMYTLQIYVGLESLPDTKHLSPLVSLVVLVYGSVGMIGTPGGIGLYTYLVAQILMAYHIAEAPAQAFGWIAWAVQTGVIVVIGVFSLLVIHPYNNRRNAKTKLGTA